jgi:hypothetical protein
MIRLAKLLNKAAARRARMGLDIVEFVMGVEDAVGVRIADKDAEAIITPRLLVDYLHARLPQSPESRCLTLRAFNRIRGALADRTGQPRSALRPGSELLAVLPPPDPQRAWEEIGWEVGDAKWPRARGNGWWARIFLFNRPRTLGDAARHLAIINPRVLKPDGEGWSRPELEFMVAGQLRHHMAIESFSFDDRFAEELGMD